MEDHITLYLCEWVNEQQQIAVFTEKVTQHKLAELPRLYSHFPPPAKEAIPPGMQVYFDGRGWTLGPAFENITEDDVQEALRVQNRMVYENEMVQLRIDQNLSDPVEFENFNVVYKLAMEADRYGVVKPIKQLIVSELKPNAGYIDINSVTDEQLSEYIRRIVANYRIYQMKAMAIFGKYRLCNKHVGTYSGPRILKTMLKGHGG